MSRKDQLRAMLDRDGKSPSGSSEPTAARHLPHMTSGAVGAMGRSLGQIANAAEAARALVAAGNSVVDIPPDRIDPSFISDRLDAEGPGYASLVESIRERGQQVPILVRPHPDHPNRYQIAYGHRRVRALAELGRSVRAVVRHLSDEELVIAQGQENSARSDLTYIEKARFATALQDHQIGNAVIMSALSMEKTQFSRLTSLGRAIPEWLSNAIGPAPKAGRPRWQLLAERLADVDATQALGRLIEEPGFRKLDSDVRFARVLNAVAQRTTTTAGRSIDVRDPEGRKIATIERSVTKLAVIVDARDEPEFSEYLVGKLPELHREFHARGRGRAETE